MQNSNAHKMILIISSNRDITTDKVIEWISCPVIRISDLDAVTEVSLSLSNSGESELILNFKSGIEVNLSKVTSCWYRRGFLSLRIGEIQNYISDGLKEFLDDEWSILSDHIYSVLSEKRSIGSAIHEKYPNKLRQLKYAGKCGLLVPETLISNNRDTILKFLWRHDCISKAITDVPSFEEDGFSYVGGYTQRVNSLEYEGQDLIFPTLFQKNIDKSYELRIFFFEKKYYSMAIFSQNDTLTSTDYRISNVEKPNRCVPYTLPENVKISLIKLMSLLGLNTGSVDIIVDKEGNYWFLEVNHVGQFDWLSVNCNFSIEKDIAQFLEYG